MLLHRVHRGSGYRRVKKEKEKQLKRRLQDSKSDVHLWNPQGTANMDPLGSTPGWLHGSALLGTQLALWEDAECTDPAQPATLWDFLDAITSLLRNKTSR